MSGPPGLGPHCVGQRVIVRRVLHGQTGPSGGPAMTDLLGVMETWADGTTTVRQESGTVTAIAIADIVTGKPVPPRPSPRLRISPADAERRACASWPAAVTEPLGSWLLRAADGYSARANSVLAVGDPEVAFPAALARVERFYAARNLPAWAQVVVDSEVHTGFTEAGWVPARPGRADTVFEIASVSKVLRAVRRAVRPGTTTKALIAPTADPAWLADDDQARAHGPVALGVLEGPEEVGFASILDGDALVAKARGVYHDDWIALTNVWVSPDHRRRGLALILVGGVLGWGAERGATTAYLQVRDDNAPAQGLYGGLGFQAHHTYRYLRAP